MSTNGDASYNAHTVADETPGVSLSPPGVSLNPDTTMPAKRHAVNNVNTRHGTLTRRSLSAWLNDVLPGKVGPQDVVRGWQWNLSRRSLRETLTRLDRPKKDTGRPLVYSQTALRGLRGNTILQPARHTYGDLHHTIRISDDGSTHPDAQASTDTR